MIEDHVYAQALQGMRESFTLVDSDGHSYTFDVGFLTSHHDCIWDRGCKGCDSRQPDHGCCHTPVHFRVPVDGDVENMEDDTPGSIRQYIERLEPEDADHYDLIQQGWWNGTPKGNDTRLATVKNGKFNAQGACIFLNTERATDGDAACSLHGKALEAGEDPTLWKPDACSIVPLRIAEFQEHDEILFTYTPKWWHWGDSEWMCTHDSNAYVGADPIFRAKEKYIRGMLPADIVDVAFDRLQARWEQMTEAQRTEPMAIPVKLIGRRTKKV